MCGDSFMRVLKLLISTQYLLWSVLRDWVLRMAGRPLAYSYVVLMYHRIRRSERVAFERQMAALKRVTRLVAVDGLDPVVGSRGRYAAVTFDDGCAGFMDVALPILRREAIPAIVFVPSGFVGRTPAWFTAEKGGLGSERLMNWNELRGLRDHGLAIGSHSVSHRALAELSDEDVDAELRLSKAGLERDLGVPIRCFALPYGSYNSGVLRRCTEAGYEWIFVSEPLAARSNVVGHVVGRIGVSPSDWSLEFDLKIRGAYQWLPIAIACKAWIANIVAGRVF